MPTDLYAVLGVPPEADAGEIRVAYLRLMRLHHPDRHLGAAEAEQRAQRLNAAYDVLGDETRRAAYDRRLAPQQAVPDPPVPRVTSRAVAYSAERTAYRRTFSTAAMQVAALLLLIGTVLLVALSAS